MFYLIDGYNLLHALGMVRRQLEPAGLERARRALLEFLKKAHGEEASAVTVVFDAAKAPPGVPAHLEYQGIQVLFAVHQDQADDLIELLIQQETRPAQLMVVSDDRRLQQAARRRSCVALGCLDYLDRLQERPRPPSAVEKAAKPVRVSPEEMEHWLHEFAALANDPDLKELFDPFGFLEDEARP